MGYIPDFYKEVELSAAQHPAIPAASHWFDVGSVSKAKD